MMTPVSALARSAAALCVGVALAMPASVALAQAKAGAKPLQGEVVKIAWIDPLSGPFGPVGNNQLKSWQFFAEKFNANNPAGVKFEIIGIDNKLSPDRKPERAEVGDRPGRPLRHPGQRLVGRAGADRRDQQAQRAQPRQGSAST